MSDHGRRDGRGDAPSLGPVDAGGKRIAVGIATTFRSVLRLTELVRVVVWQWGGDQAGEDHASEGDATLQSNPAWSGSSLLR